LTSDLDMGNGTTSSTGGHRSKDDLIPVARKESNQIYWLFVVLSFKLFLAAFVAAFVLFKVTPNGEDDQFEMQYNGNAIKIIQDAFEATMRNTIGAIDNYTIITLIQCQSMDYWPFVVSINVEVCGASTRSLIGSAGLLSVILLDTEENRIAWEQYLVNNLGWVEDGLHFHETGHCRELAHGDHGSKLHHEDESGSWKRGQITC
jgi:hypothetical protein